MRNCLRFVWRWLNVKPRQKGLMRVRRCCSKANLLSLCMWCLVVEFRCIFWRLMDAVFNSVKCSVTITCLARWSFLPLCLVSGMWWLKNRFKRWSFVLRSCKSALNSNLCLACFLLLL
ncbi:Uncharacterised protein [Vibrio cholerae]|uniref:Uncharacterized protein n=1 Tax=Vibrio cholerae TaxID=666 RepID=A0A655X540_VIBCL|nr:Uncharacterised protein [Vibrio cholerae]CSC04070.1 Uncharacterised protein [Vibrio cholerae]